MNLSLMDIQNISPDEVVFWSWRFVSINAILVFTWAVMALLLLISVLVTRRLSSDIHLSRWQNLLETLVGGMRDQIREISGGQDPSRYLAFVGTIFLFLALSNFLAIVPGFESPAASLSTTAGLALCVFVAVPAYGINQKGLFSYLKHYIEPTVFMLPFNIMGELSRTLALAVRLFGNVMSGGKIVTILLALTPIFFPIVIGAIGPAIGEGRAVASALSSMAQQPDETNTITRTLFVGLAMIESTAIYCFVVSMILIFANPFWNYVVENAGG